MEKKATKNISHRLQIIDCTRFMASSLLNLVSKILLIKSFMQTSRNDFLLCTNSLTIISISWFHCDEIGVSPDEYMDDWEKFNELLPGKEDFYSHLNMGDNRWDYEHTKRGYKNLEIKKWGEYHYLYLRRDTLLLADVFEIFRNMYFELRFLTLPE